MICILVVPVFHCVPLYKSYVHTFISDPILTFPLPYFLFTRAFSNVITNYNFHVLCTRVLLRFEFKIPIKSCTQLWPPMKNDP